MDIWVEQTEENYKKLVKAFAQFRMPVFDMTLANFLAIDKNDVFSFGRNPVGIDILISVKGLNFKEAFESSNIFEDEELPVRVLHFDQLIKAKKAAGRLKDQDDIRQLQKRRKK